MRSVIYFPTILILLFLHNACSEELPKRDLKLDYVVPKTETILEQRSKKLNKFKIADSGELSSCSANNNENIANKFKSLKQDTSNCPTEPWFLAMANDDPLSKKTLINIGANKGYNIAFWMDSFIPSMALTPHNWYVELQKLYPNLRTGVCTPCGCCDDCQAKFDHSYHKYPSLYDLSRSTHLDIIVADLNCDNIKLIKDVFLGLSNSSFPRLNDQVSVFSLCAGLSDKTGEITLPRCVASSEVCGLKSKDNNFGRKDIVGKETVTVPLVTVDEMVLNYLLSKVKTYVHGNYSLEEFQNHQQLLHRLQSALQDERNPSAQQILHQTIAHVQYFYKISTTKAYRPLIDFLIIDTEGFDYLVIQGGKQLFESRSLRAFIFEYHELPPWDQYKLGDLQQQLDGYGYECFIEGQSRLWPITGKTCWHENYEFHRWSNVFCVRREDIWYRTIQPFVVRSV